MLDFVIVDISLALSRYALRYAIALTEKIFLLLVCFVIHKYLLFISILKFQWLIQIHRCKYLQHYRRTFSSCRLNEELPHIPVSSYNESEIELFCIKWFLVNRLTRHRLLPLWNVWSLFSCTVYLFSYKNNNKIYAARNKGFRNYLDSKPLTLKAELLFNYHKKFRF